MTPPYGSMARCVDARMDNEDTKAKLKRLHRIGCDIRWMRDWEGERARVEGRKTRLWGVAVVRAGRQLRDAGGCYGIDLGNVDHPQHAAKDVLAEHEATAMMLAIDAMPEAFWSREPGAVCDCGWLNPGPFGPNREWVVCPKCGGMVE